MASRTHEHTLPRRFMACVGPQFFSRNGVPQSKKDAMHLAKSCQHHRDVSYNGGGLSVRADESLLDSFVTRRDVLINANKPIPKPKLNPPPQ